jgi:hypothetical protein
VVQRLFCAFLFSTPKLRRTEQKRAENSVDQYSECQSLRQQSDAWQTEPEKSEQQTPRPFFHAAILSDVQLYGRAALIRVAGLLARQWRFSRDIRPYPTNVSVGGKGEWRNNA